MDGWMDGLMDGRTDGWLGGQIETDERQAMHAMHINESSPHRSDRPESGSRADTGQDHRGAKTIKDCLLRATPPRRHERLQAGV